MPSDANATSETAVAAPSRGGSPATTTEAVSPSLDEVASRAFALLDEGARLRSQAKEEASTPGMEHRAVSTIRFAQLREREARALLVHTAVPTSSGELVPADDALARLDADDDLVTLDASRQRMELLGDTGSRSLASDLARSRKPRNASERMLLHQTAALHVAGMEAVTAARQALADYGRKIAPGRALANPDDAASAARLLNAGARAFEAGARLVDVLERGRRGGRQRIEVVRFDGTSGDVTIARGQADGARVGDDATVY